jgi:hypothetical protein
MAKAMHTLLQRIYKKNIAFFVRFVNYFFFKRIYPDASYGLGLIRESAFGVARRPRQTQI